MAQDKIVVRGAREHNLKNIHLEIPRDKLVVITGLSGSGKSSLAFDTIYAEGQRRYVESLSAYARQFLEQMEKPDVDTIEGLSPAISIEQKTTSRNPRSTVGTVTEIHDYLRLLFARVGRPHCPECGKEIKSQTVQQIVDQVMCPPGRNPAADPRPHRPRAQGRVPQGIRPSAEKRLRAGEGGRDRARPERGDPPGQKQKAHHRCPGRPAGGEGECPKTAGRFPGDGPGSVRGDRQSGDRRGEELVFSENFACVDCGVSLPEITPRMFSFNNPYGACPECDGLGTKMYFDPDLIVPNPDLSIREGAVSPGRGGARAFSPDPRIAGEHYKIDLYAPFRSLPPETQQARPLRLERRADQVLQRPGRPAGNFYYRDFEGVIPSLERRYRETDSEIIREEMEKYMNFRPCPACQGARLKQGEPLRQDQRPEHPPGDPELDPGGPDFFSGLNLSPREKEIARRILKEIAERLGFLVNVGLDYLTLSRPAATLSGGESQRIRLATQIGSGLVGVLYILDEPSIGLHQRDNARLLATLKRLRDLGNTDPGRGARRGDDPGGRLRHRHRPRGGIHGGEVVFSGTPEEMLRSREFPHRPVPFGRRRSPCPANRRQPRANI